MLERGAWKESKTQDEYVTTIFRMRDSLKTKKLNKNTDSHQVEQPEKLQRYPLQSTQNSQQSFYAKIRSNKDAPARLLSSGEQKQLDSQHQVRNNDTHSSTKIAPNQKTDISASNHTSREVPFRMNEYSPPHQKIINVPHLTDNRKPVSMRVLRFIAAFLGETIPVDQPHLISEEDNTRYTMVANSKEFRQWVHNVVAKRKMIFQQAAGHQDGSSTGAETSSSLSKEKAMNRRGDSASIHDPSIYSQRGKEHISGLPGLERSSSSQHEMMASLGSGAIKSSNSAATQRGNSTMGIQASENIGVGHSSHDEKQQLTNQEATACILRLYTMLSDQRYAKIQSFVHIRQRCFDLWEYCCLKSVPDNNRDAVLAFARALLSNKITKFSPNQLNQSLQEISLLASRSMEIPKLRVLYQHGMRYHKQSMRPRTSLDPEMMKRFSGKPKQPIHSEQNKNELTGTGNVDNLHVSQGSVLPYDCQEYEENADVDRSAENEVNKSRVSIPKKETDTGRRGKIWRSEERTRKGSTPEIDRTCQQNGSRKIISVDLTLDDPLHASGVSAERGALADHSEKGAEHDVSADRKSTTMKKNGTAASGKTCESQRHNMKTAQLESRNRNESSQIQGCNSPARGNDAEVKENRATEPAQKSDDDVFCQTYGIKEADLYPGMYDLDDILGSIPGISTESEEDKGIEEFDEQALIELLKQIE